MTDVIKRCLGVLAVATYVLPLATGLLTNVVHDAYHLREYLEHGTAEVADVQQQQPGEFVHAHGGAEHSHDATTDALLGAADRTDEPNEEHHAPTLELVGHLPAQVAVLDPVDSVDGRQAVDLHGALPTSPPPPPLPPPRV